MNRKNKHLNKYLYGSLPDPEVPTDDAWADMNGMLDSSAATERHSHPDGFFRTWKSILKFKMVLVTVSIVTITAAVVLWTFVKRSDEAKRNKMTVQPSVYEKKTPHKTFSELSEPLPHNETLSQSSESSNSGPRSGSRKAVFENAAKTTDDRSHAASLKKTDTATITSHSGSIAATKPGSRSLARNNTSRLEETTTEAPASRRKTTSNPGSLGESDRSVRRRIQPESFIQSPQDLKGGNTQSRFAGNASATSVSHEKNDVPLGSDNFINSLLSMPGHFESDQRNLTARIKAPATESSVQQATKPDRVLHQGIHFGPEWSASGIDPNSPYLFAGADSVSRPARAAIPGLFLTKTWNRHGVTFTFLPVQSYFGDNKRIKRQTETIRQADSSFTDIHYNVNFIKATGMNFSLQYQYVAAKWFSLNAGISYARFSNALIRKETEDSTGRLTQGPLVTVKKSGAMEGYVHPRQWALKAGVIVHPRIAFNSRIPVGLNVILPVSNLSKDTAFDVKMINWQIYLRFLIR